MVCMALGPTRTRISGYGWERWRCAASAGWGPVAWQYQIHHVRTRDHGRHVHGLLPQALQRGCFENLRCAANQRVLECVFRLALADQFTRQGQGSREAVIEIPAQADGIGECLLSASFDALVEECQQLA